MKGACLLTKLKYFKSFTSTIIDTMHSVFLGVVKNLFYYLFEAIATNSETHQYFSFKKKLELLNKKFNRLQES